METSCGLIVQESLWKKHHSIPSSIFSNWNSPYGIAGLSQQKRSGALIAIFINDIAWLIRDVFFQWRVTAQVLSIWYHWRKAGIHVRINVLFRKIESKLINYFIILDILRIRGSKVPGFTENKTRIIRRICEPLNHREHDTTSPSSRCIVFTICCKQPKALCDSDS